MPSLKQNIRKITHGLLPYVWERICGVETAATPYYVYILKHGYARHLYTFREEYEAMKIDVMTDPAKGLRYVVTPAGRKLYFRRDMDEAAITRLYRSLLMEQDRRSPHLYFNGTDEVKGRNFADVGCAEGLIALEVADVARHLYLFECDERWIEALEATMEPWKDKVTIVRKFVGDTDGESFLRLDTMFPDPKSANLFVKMDIEGAERKAIEGARGILKHGRNEFAICAYHDDDTDVLPGMLDSLGCRYIRRKGYFRGRVRNVVLRGQGGR